MKILVVSVLALAVVTTARNIDLEAVIDLEEITAFGYHTKVGQALAERIRKAEEESDRNPSRIVGGSASQLGEFPYQAGLVIDYVNGQSACGGSLLNSRRVLTAAHCWFDGQNQALRFTVVLGSIRLFSGGTRIPTSSVTMHGSWNPSLIRNDIAIINLPTNVVFSSTIAPIALPSGNEINNQFAGATAVASGFGYTAEGEIITVNQFLSHVSLPVITNDVCRESYHIFVDSSNICTSGAGARGTCQGDSGGPLAVVSNNRRIVIGIASFGHWYGCEAGHPSAFARVTSYINWINNLL